MPKNNKNNNTTHLQQQVPDNKETQVINTNTHEDNSIPDNNLFNQDSQEVSIKGWVEGSEESVDDYSNNKNIDWSSTTNISTTNVDELNSIPFTSTSESEPAIIKEQGPTKEVVREMETAIESEKTDKNTDIMVIVLCEIQTTIPSAILELKARLNNAGIKYVETDKYIMAPGWTTDANVANVCKKELLSKGFKPVVKLIKEEELANE